MLGRYKMETTLRLFGHTKITVPEVGQVYTVGYMDIQPHVGKCGLFITIDKDNHRFQLIPTPAFFKIFPSCFTWVVESLEGLDFPYVPLEFVLEHTSLKSDLWYTFPSA